MMKKIFVLLLIISVLAMGCGQKTAVPPKEVPPVQQAPSVPETPAEVESISTDLGNVQDLNTDELALSNEDMKLLEDV